MNHYGTQRLVTKLVDNSPGKAIDILTRCCDDSKILDEVTSYVLQLNARQYETPTPPANRFDITFAPPLSPTSHSSHNTGTPPPRQRLPRRLSSTTYPLSPPGTASSVASHSTRDGSSSVEYVLLPTIVGGKVVEHMVRMKDASIMYSVIRNDVVGKRNLEESPGLVQAEVTHVDVPHRPSGQNQLVPVSCAIELTWRRPHSDSTHNTLFYVVPNGAIDTDILLGYKDSGEGIAEYTPTIVPQQARQAPSFHEYKQEMRPHAPTPPSASYHRSAMTQSESHRASPVFHQDGQHHPYHMVEPFLARQQSFGTAMGTHQPSPAHTVLGSHIEHPQPLRPSPAPATPARDTDPKKATDRIRLSLVWDATTLNVWLDLNAHGEAFYKAFQQQATKQRKDISDRATMTVLLKKDKSIPDEEGYALSLDEDDLEADWETTLEWLDANRRDKSPHLCGVVEMEEG